MAIFKPQDRARCLPGGEPRCSHAFVSPQSRPALEPAFSFKMKPGVWIFSISVAALSAAVFIGFRPASPPPSVATVAPFSSPSPQAAAGTATVTDDVFHAFDAINAAADATTPESVAVLVTYASSENAEIRSAALDALIRQGDPAAAPFLRAAAKQTGSSAAVIDLLQTADYLELPPGDLSALAARPKHPKRPAPAGSPLVPQTRP